jgi:hypothetical protein
MQAALAAVKIRGLGLKMYKGMEFSEFTVVRVAVSPRVWVMVVDEMVGRTLHWLAMRLIKTNKHITFLISFIF